MHLLVFVRFLLKDGQLWLCEPQARQIWECLAVDAIYTCDRENCFKWFTKVRCDIIYCMWLTVVRYDLIEVVYKSTLSYLSVLHRCLVIQFNRFTRVHFDAIQRQIYCRQSRLYLRFYEITYMSNCYSGCRSGKFVV